MRSIRIAESLSPNADAAHRAYPYCQVPSSSSGMTAGPRAETEAQEHSSRPCRMNRVLFEAFMVHIHPLHGGASGPGPDYDRFSSSCGHPPIIQLRQEIRMERHTLRIDNTPGPQRPFYPPLTATASRRIVQARTGASADASEQPSTGSRKASLVGRNLRRRFRRLRCLRR